MLYIALNVCSISSLASLILKSSSVILSISFSVRVYVQLTDS